MSGKLARISEPVMEELVAYLDGELAFEEVSALEQRLADEPRLREQLQVLQSTWDVLDHLDSPQTSPAFTSTTLGLVVQQVQADRGRIAGVPRGVLAAAWIVGMVAVASLAFLWAHFRGRAPEQRLLRDLPVIENVDLYAHAADVDFLLALDETGLFSEEPGVEP